jgi:hypothetical protein
MSILMRLINWMSEIMEVTTANLGIASRLAERVFARMRTRVWFRWLLWPVQRIQALAQVELSRTSMQDTRRVNRLCTKLDPKVDYDSLDDEQMLPWQAVVLAILSVLSFLPVVGIIFAIIGLILSLIWLVTDAQIAYALANP